MIRTYFGLERNPFSSESVTLLPHQQDVFDILGVHGQQGGLCLLMGDPGTGKSAIKDAVRQRADKRQLVVTVGRTLHTYMNTLKILCQAFAVDAAGTAFKCERALLAEAHKLNGQGKSLAIIIDDAHLMDVQSLRRLRLLLDDFPKSHNLILAGHADMLNFLTLRVNEDIRSRVTYSTILPKLTDDGVVAFVGEQLEKAGLGGNILDADALSLIGRQSEGVLRRARNLCLATLLEAVRRGRKQVGIEVVNAVLRQPHWRLHSDLDYEMPKRLEPLEKPKLENKVSKDPVGV